MKRNENPELSVTIAMWLWFAAALAALVLIS